MKHTLLRPVQVSERLVVIAGWLGSQPKQLRRYEELYEQMGFQTHSRIATPSMIVKTCLDSSSKIHMPTNWPPSRNSLTSVEDLAWDILARVHETQSKCVIFHVLSNGGCFVWEHIRLILGGIHNDPNSDSVQPILTSIQKSLRGVVFDSCPATDVACIDRALEYCSETEQADVLRELKQDSLSFLRSDSSQQLLNARSTVYVDRLGSDDWALPQLYLYSESDHLATAPGIDALVDRRRDLLGKRMIWRRRWKNSPHVSHIREHPSDYKNAVDSFVEFCLKDDLKSSL
jgi:hypothetical protein